MAENRFHSEKLLLALHPDLAAYVRERAKHEYCTVTDYLRRLIVEDMHKKQTTDD